MLNVAIVGAGNISRLHFEGYTAFPDRCQIVAIVDIIPEKAEAAKKKYNLDARVYATHTEMLAKEKNIDLVSVCTPPYCHAEIAIDAMLVGDSNVLVEKPMAASLEECDRMLEAEKKSGKILSSVAQNRFRDPIMNVKRVLEKGLIGQIVHAQIDSHWWRGHCYYDLWWRGRWDKEGGGCTLNHAVHHIDMLQWMMGLPEKVTAILTNTSHDNAEVEDLSVAILQYPNGALAQVTSSVVHHGELQTITFQGKDAKIAAPFQVAAEVSKPNGFPEKNTALEKEITDFVESQKPLTHIAHNAQIDNVLTAIETNGRPYIDGVSGRASVELITAIYKAGSLGQTVDLPLKKNDPFYKVEGILASVPRFFEKTSALESLGTPEDITVGSDYDKKKS